MSKNNAPQPDAANAAAEVFDSTIIPSSGEVSQDQLPGPDNREAPMHSGEMNGIDPFLMTQFIALTSVVWDTSMSVGQLLWSIPIHPSFIHVYTAHLAKMYNAYAGGFDAGVVIAGTGFHAGKLLVVRLPPNIKPSSITRITDATAFPYYVIDPKTLEVVVKSAMDQRNVMYHYLPYDENNIQSFGGYLAIYVLLPLNTSATGATQISVQIFSRPAQNFLFTQLRPLRSDTINPYRPESIEQALNFSNHRTASVFLENLETMTVNTGTEIKELTFQTNNCVKLDGTPMNGELFERLPQTWYFNAKWLAELKTFYIQVSDPSDGTLEFYNQTKEGLVSFDFISKDDQVVSTNAFPLFTSNSVHFGVRVADQNGRTFYFAVPCKLRHKQNTDPADTREFVFEAQGFFATLTKTWLEAKSLDDLIREGKITEVFINFQNPIVFETTYVPYAPPIKESVITFESENSVTAQPYELTQAIQTLNLSTIMSKHNSLVFELYDTLVDLPLIPIRLHYDGYFSSVSVSKNIIYKLTDPFRYKFVYVGMIPETTAMVSSRLPLSTMAKYIYNMSVSRIASSSPALV